MHPNVWYFFSYLVAFASPDVCNRAAVFQVCKMCAFIQMLLFWSLNVTNFSNIFLKCFSFYFIFSHQNKCIWLIECTYFTYLQNLSSITNTWWWKCNQIQKKCQTLDRLCFLKLLATIVLGISSLLIITQTFAR